MHTHILGLMTKLEDKTTNKYILVCNLSLYVI